MVIRDASLNADDMASQSVRLKEEQLRKEEEKVNLISFSVTHARKLRLIIITQLREIELKVQREIQEKRAELLSKEEALRSLEARLAQAQISEE